jgi:uncharacterized protein YoxC
MTGSDVLSTIGTIAGLIIALSFLITAVFVARFLAHLSGSIKELTSAMGALNSGITEAMPEVRRLVIAANGELEKVGVVTEDVAKLSGHASSVANDASQLSGLITSTIAKPLVKLSAFSYGVRRAINSLKKSR